ncbi:hypothetical protein C8Q79DRAFT_930110 [Trametes meyenii]|nr:hypothetical protein C8Q79DRAFT_930110 [Trametes meyenii]
MGNVLARLLDEAHPADPDAIKEEVARLHELAELRLDVFRARLAQTDPLHLPIGRVFYSNFRVDCSVSNDAGKVKETVEDSIGAFVSGKVVEGVTAITGQALDILLGDTSASSSHQEIHALGVGPLGGVYRIDAQFYAYTFRAQTLKTVLQTVVSSAIVISSAEVKDMKRNEVKNLVQNAYKGIPLADLQILYKDIWTSICEDRADEKELALPHAKPEELKHRMPIGPVVRPPNPLTDTPSDTSPVGRGDVGSHPSDGDRESNVRSPDQSRRNTRRRGTFKR